MFKIQTVFILLILIFAACSGGEEIEIPEEIAAIENLSVFELPETPPHEISFEPEAYYGETDDVLIGRFNSAVADDQGRVYLADSDQNTIHVFQPDGTYSQSIGKEGKGPGEFVNISSLQSDEKNLYANDFSQRRINVFALESLQFSHTVPLMPGDSDIEELSGTYPSSYFVLPDSTFLVSFSKPFRSAEEDENRKTLYYKLDHEGSLVSEQIISVQAPQFVTYESGNSVTFWYTEFSGSPLVTPSRGKKIYTAWSQDFLIRVHNPEGKQTAARYYPFDKVPLLRDDALKLYDNDLYRKAVSRIEIPPHWPAMKGIHTDDQNRLWVSTFVEDKESYQWWVLGGDGEPLATFTWPRTRSIADIKNGYLYARETDEMGLAQVVKYRVEGL